MDSGDAEAPGQSFSTYNRLQTSQTALVRTTRSQIAVAAALLAVAAGLLVWDWHRFLVLLIAIITLAYFADLLFNFYLITHSFFFDPPCSVDPALLAVEREWPKFTILCPLYKEWQVLPQFIRAISLIDYPPEQLEVLLLLEEDDVETVSRTAAMTLPPAFRVLVVPDGRPKTKPKACNYGLQRATGDLIVIYDAEDIPERDQLKKAVVSFENCDEEVVCLQAMLNYYNTRQNTLTKLFTLEYSLWFDLVLSGLHAVRAPIPLGGTSNHFRTPKLRELGGWDAFNVTEDADLGMRIARRGYRTAMLGSTTMEEANSKVGNWHKQRSRWIKGYIQTYLVHTRGNGGWGSRRWLNRLEFQLIIGGKTMSLLINPILWLLTLCYFLFRPVVGPFIESLYPAPVFYIGLFSLVIGNFLYLYYYMMGAARRDQWGLAPFALLVPLYWLGMSAAAYYAVYEMLLRPHYWHKTTHGLHLAGDNAKQAEALIS